MVTVVNGPDRRRMAAVVHGANRMRGVRAIAAVVLATAACAPVLPHVAMPSMAIEDPAFVRTLEAVTKTPAVDGNRVHILLNGDQFFPAQLAAVRAARTTITYAQYFYHDGAVGQELAEALAERCRAGVRASVLLDGFGALRMPDRFAELMKRAGCEVATFRPLSHLGRGGRLNHRNHRRILVVDGRVAFTGGAGISEKWTGDGRTDGHWRDTDVRVEGPVVQYLQAAFAENWLEATGVVLGGDEYFPPLAPRGDVTAQVVASSPAKGDFAMYTTLLLAIASARRSIDITNPYFVPDERMTEALLAAVARGVRVTVLVPGAIDRNIVRAASRRNYGPFLRAGVELYEYHAALLHAKTMVIDGMWATIGSTNLDNRSFALNAELNLVLYSRPVAAQLERIFTDDLRYSRRITLTSWQTRPVWQRLLELVSVPFREQL
jgi:cardiolipin synthase